MSLQRVPINNFRGGLNTRDSPFELQANESPDLLNVTVSALVGQLEQRKGRTRYDISGLPENEKVDNAKQVVIGANKRALMLSINGSIWQCNTAGEVKKLFKGTAGSIWTFEVFSDAAFKDWVYCANGVNKYQKWDGEAAATVEWLFNGAESGNVGSILRVWENRMFVSGVTANPQRVYFSEFGDPEATIKEYGFVDVRGPEDDLDAVQDIAVLGARLFILKRRSVFYISSAVTMANRRVGGPGVWGRFQTVELEDKLYFFNPQGIWTTAGVEISMETGSINSYFPTKVNKAALNTVRIMTTRDTYPRLLLTLPTGANTTPDTLLEMVPHINFRRIGGRRYLLLPAFFLHSMPSTALANWNPTGEEELIIGTGAVASTAGKTTFPSMAITDSFERANEEPLSNGGAWTKLTGFASNLILKSNLVSWKKVGEAASDRYTSSGEMSSPAVEVELVTLPSVSLAEIELFCCLKAEEIFNNGYRALFSSNSNEVLINKKVGGVNTNLGLFALPKIPPENTRLGMTVLEGKIKIWWNIAGKGWELLVEVADASFTKGYSGIGLFQAPTEFPGIVTLRNFRTVAIPATVNRLSSLFTGTTDEGAEITAHWHSAWMAIQGEEPKERVRRLNIELQGDAVLDVFTDFSELPRFSETVPKSEEAEQEYRFARVRPETHGRFHSVKVRSLAGGKPFLINVMEMVVRGGKEH